jgi:large subunit ribosomal protein L22
MQTQAVIKYQRISPKKMKYIAREATGKSAEYTAERLLLMGNKAAKALSKAIFSALANMKNKGQTDISAVKIQSVSVNKGPILKRWNPVSRGMAHSIKKRTSHIKVVLIGEEIKKAIAVKKTDDKKLLTKDIKNTVVETQSKERSKRGA